MSPTVLYKSVHRELIVSPYLFPVDDVFGASDEELAAWTAILPEPAERRRSIGKPTAPFPPTAATPEAVPRSRCLRRRFAAVGSARSVLSWGTPATAGGRRCSSAGGFPPRSSSSPSRRLPKPGSRQDQRRPDEAGELSPQVSQGQAQGHQDSREQQVARQRAPQPATAWVGARTRRL